MAEQQTPSKPHSEYLRAALGEYKEKTRFRKRAETVGLMGTVALEGAGYVELFKNMRSGNIETGMDLALAGMTIGGITLVSWLGRADKTGRLERAAKKAETREQIVAALPVTAPKYGVRDAIEYMAMDARHAKIDNDKEVDPKSRALGQFRSYGPQELVASYKLWGVEGIENGIAGMAITALNTYRGALQTDLGTQKVKMESMFEALDTFLPIDQTADTVTHVNQETGIKSWEGYIQGLHFNGGRTEELAKLIGYPLDAIQPLTV